MVLDELGSGNIGKVFLAIKGCPPENGSYAALKVWVDIISPVSFQNYLKQEYKILLALSDHVNIVKLLPQDRYSVLKGSKEIYYLVLEYCPGGNLEQFRRQYPGGVLPAAALADRDFD